MDTKQIKNNLEEKLQDLLIELDFLYYEVDTGQSSINQIKRDISSIDEMIEDLIKELPEILKEK